MIFFAILVLLATFIWYVFNGYLLLLQLWSRSHRATKKGHQSKPSLADAFSVTILVTVCNEAPIIVKRISNLLSQRYPSELLEILVASDGSTDNTAELVEGIGHPCVRVYRAPRRMGKTATQNMAIREARGEIVIFTDADTEFDSCFVEKIVAPFKHDIVGAADGHLIFRQEDVNQLAESQGRYWDYELRLRQAESELGILAVASGACLALRRSLFREMEPSIGEDCIVPLDVVSQGYRVVHVTEAIAYDRMERTPDREFSARVRMTLRNWQGTWSRPDLLSPIRHPGIACALWSHKILRWLTPFFVVAIVFTANLWATQGAAVGWGAATLVDSLILAALVGWWGNYAGLRLPLASSAFSFMLANAGFMVGVLRAIFGHSIREYR